MRWMVRKRSETPDVGAVLPTATTVVECWDETQPASVVLAGADDTSALGDREQLFRVLLYLGESEVPAVVARLGGDEYRTAPARPTDPPAPGPLVAVALARSLCVTAQSVAQELAVLASITTRAGGQFAGWAVLATLAE